MAHHPVQANRRGADQSEVGLLSILLDADPGPRALDSSEVVSDSHTISEGGLICATIRTKPSLAT
jgi:hypothetical protein